LTGAVFAGGNTPVDVGTSDPSTTSGDCCRTITRLTWLIVLLLIIILVVMLRR
jgi:hypothetical protein